VQVNAAASPIKAKITKLRSVILEEDISISNYSIATMLSIAVNSLCCFLTYSTIEVFIVIKKIVEKKSSFFREKS
jgi:hypothetical protein